MQQNLNLSCVEEGAEVVLISWRWFVDLFLTLNNLVLINVYSTTIMFMCSNKYKFIFECFRLCQNTRMKVLIYEDWE